MARKSILPPLQTKEYYSNVLLTAPDGTRLATVGHDRAEWYLSRDLGIEVPTQEPYARTIQLKFEPKGRPVSTRGLHVKETRCVVCGTTEGLTLHHVVPRLIRKSFPEKDSNRQHLWCLLLCESHHLEVEAIYAPILTKSSGFKELQKAAQKRPAPDKRLTALRIIHNLMQQGVIARLQESHPARVTTLLMEAGLKELPAPGEIETTIAKMLESEPAGKSSEVTTAFATRFIQENGGVEKVKELFRTLFLKLEPKYLPAEALSDIY